MTEDTARGAEGVRYCAAAAAPEVPIGAACSPLRVVLAEHAACFDRVPEPRFTYRAYEAEVAAAAVASGSEPDQLPE